MTAVDWAFVGQNEMGASALEALSRYLGAPRVVITREPTQTHPNRVEEVAERLGVAATCVPDHRLDGMREALAACDVLACCGWARRIPAGVFSSPRLGTLNLHPGSLPSWSGSDPLGWRRAAGADTIEVTVHRMTELIDEGDVLGTAVFTVDDPDTGHDLRQRAGEVLGTLAARVVSGGLTVPEMTVSPVVRATPPRGVTPAIESLVMQRVDVERVVRSFSPYPGVLARVDGSWIRVRTPEGDDAVTCVLQCADDELRVEGVAAP